MGAVARQMYIFYSVPVLALRLCDVSTENVISQYMSSSGPYSEVCVIVHMPPMHPNMSQKLEDFQIQLNVVFLQA